MKKKSYKITFDLKEGYTKEGKEHPLSFAEDIIKGWMEERLQQNQPIITGLLQSGTLFYPSAHILGPRIVTVAHSAIFTGELSSPRDMKRKRKEIRSTLESLALVLKQRLNQESVFIIYRKDNWHV